MYIKHNKDTLKQKPSLPLINLISLCTLLTLVFSIISLFSHVHHLIELTSHFKLHYLIASLIFTLTSLYLRQWIKSILLCLCFILNAYFIVPLYFSNHQTIPKDQIFSISPQQQKTKIKLIHLNILSSNRNQEAITRLITQENPDIFLVQEVDNFWHNYLKKLKNQYPYQLILPRTDNFGIALLSKIEPIEIKDFIINLSDTPSIFARFPYEDKYFNLISAHPLPPINVQYFQRRNLQLNALINKFNTDQNPTIITGDFNITPWSSYYQVIESSKFRNARDGIGILATWPANFLFFGIPIDHIFVSPEVKVLSLKTGKSVGSDHLPLITEVELE